MTTDPLMNNELNRDIISLLAVSKIPPLEKRMWLAALPHMTDEEKTELKENLEQEVEYEIKVTEQATETFLAALKKGI